VARACAKTGAFLIHISSNAVFDGTRPPYAEGSTLSAVNRYGRIKIEAEEAVRESGGAHLILRPILMYGWPLAGGRENAVTRWLAQMEQGSTVEAAVDITSMPLSAHNCAEAVWAAARRRLTGAVHVAGGDSVTLFQFARETAHIFGFDPARVHPVPSSHWAELAPRPKDTSFVTARMQQGLGVRPVGISEGLTQMLRSRVCSPL
jgi:dTDP-4-dehydrorhamnose reductase